MERWLSRGEIKRRLKALRANVAERAYGAVIGGRVRVRRYARENNIVPARTDLTVEQWLAICESWNYRCAYCGSLPSESHSGQQLQMDHIEPILRGGDHSSDNVLPVCGNCNIAKGQLLFLEWACVELDIWKSGKGRAYRSVRMYEPITPECRATSENRYVFKLVA